MGVSVSGDAKYYLDLSFTIEPQLDKLALKKRYKQQIRQLIQVYIDRKSAIKPATKPLPEGKKDSKVLKILEAIEKGKANLNVESTVSRPKPTTLVAQSPRGLATTGSPRAGTFKKMQNLFVAKEVNQVNKIKVMVNSNPVETMQEEFKRSYASSSFYINGLPTVKLEKEGEVRRLIKPQSPTNRFEEVKYKEYKSIKASGEQYVQDFISVLEGDANNMLSAPGSPKAVGFSPRGSPTTNVAPLSLPIIEEADSPTRTQGAVKT